MARPRKFRKVCHFPRTLTFLPIGEQVSDESVVLSVDEYETLRLIDKEGKSQEECSTSMKVARTTVQSIYTMARKKVADAIIDGRPLVIAGGDYDLCNGRVEYCPRKECFKKKLHSHYQKKKDEYFRFAIPEREGKVAENFQEAEKFMLIDFLKNQQEETQYVGIEEKKRASLSDFMHILEVDYVLCDSIDEASVQALKEVDIWYCTGVKQDIKEKIQAVLSEAESW